MKYIILFILFTVITNCQTETEQKTTQDPAQDFFENFEISGANDEVPDLSEEYFSSQLEETRAKLNKLQTIDTTELSFEEKIDWHFAHSILKGREIRQANHESWKKDPREYMQFRSLGNLIESPGNPDGKVSKLMERLTVLPQQLENGQKQIEFYVPRFQELSLFMAENVHSLFYESLPEFASKTESKQELLDLITKAQGALTAYTNFIKEDLPQKPKADFATSEETYNQILKHEFLLDYDSESLYEFGQQKFNETVAELEALAREIDSTKTWQELIKEVKNDHPKPHEMIEAHQLWVDSSKAHILNNNLIPIPWEEQVVVVPRAEYLRKTSYYGNFSRAREKDEEGIYTAQWMINPFEDQWDEKTKQEYLVEHDWGVIIVTAPHEAYGGHHVQGLYQMHNPRKIRRENGLSLFSEGWGLYNEQLMSETGFFPNKRIHLRQLQLRLWRNARVIYDVGMHSGRMSYDEALALMTDKVGFLPWAAQLEVDSASERPGYFIGYYIGMSEILRIRDRYRQMLGEKFTLSDFHENLLKIGNMPPKLMEEALIRKNEVE